MLKSLFSDNRAAFDIVNIVAGLGLALSPWLFGFTAETYAAWNAWIVGAGVAIIAIVALFAFHQAEEWVNLALGLWSMIAPWALGFAGVTAAATAHVVVGLIVALVAAGSLWLITNRPYSSA